MRTPILALVTALAIPSMTSAQAAPPGPPVVVVQGEGVLRRAPDQALVRIGAESRSKDPRDAQSANASAMAAVLDRIGATGVPRDAVRTTAISLQPEFDYRDGRQTLRGYVARNAVEVRVDDLSRLDDVLDASVGAGATSLQGLQFDLQRRDDAEREALSRAVADALARAEAAAKGAGRAVERVLRIEEAGAPAVLRPQTLELARMSADAAQPGTPVAQGEIEIRARVTVTAAIK